MKRAIDLLYSDLRAQLRDGQFQLAEKLFAEISTDRPWIARLLAQWVDHHGDSLLVDNVRYARSPSIAEKLLSFGADPNMRIGDTHLVALAISLDSATLGPMDDLVEKLLIFGANPNEKATVTGTLPLLHWVILNAPFRYLGLLIKFGADPLMPSEIGLSAIDVARGLNNKAKAEFLETYVPINPQWWPDKAG